MLLTKIYDMWYSSMCFSGEQVVAELEAEMVKGKQKEKLPDWRQRELRRDDTDLRDIPFQVCCALS